MTGKNQNTLKFLLEYAATFSLVGALGSLNPDIGRPFIQDSAVCFDVENARINQLVLKSIYNDEFIYPLDDEVKIREYIAPKYELPKSNIINIIDGEKEFGDSLFTKSYHFVIPVALSNYDEIVEALNNQDYDYFFNNYSNYIRNNPQERGTSGIVDTNLTYIQGSVYNIGKEEITGSESLDHNVKVTYVEGILSFLITIGIYTNCNSKTRKRKISID